MYTSDDITFAICQLESDLAEADVDPRPANWERAVAAMDAAGPADVYVFGEGYLNGYESAEHLWRCALDESPRDPWVATLVTESAARDAVMIVGATTRKGTFPGDLYNSAVVVDRGEYLGTYNKNHVAAMLYDGDRLAKERLYWSPGTSLPVWDTSAGRLGIEICYDVMFPEVARSLALLGAEVVVNVSAAVVGFETMWDHVLPTRAVENSIWYLHVSVVGKQRDTELFGGSRLFGPDGGVTVEAPRHEPSILVARADRTALRRIRGTTHHFANRNPRLYAPITEEMP
jgi:predicted amidohydrolase